MRIRLLITLIVGPGLRDLQHDCPLAAQGRFSSLQSKHPTELVSEGVPHEAGWIKFKSFALILSTLDQVQDKIDT